VCGTLTIDPDGSSARLRRSATLRAIAAVLAIEWLCRGRLSHRQNESAIPLSERHSFFRDCKRDESRVERPAANKKFRALMESWAMSRASSRAAPGERYDARGERYDLQAAVLIACAAPSICRLKTQLLSLLISLSSD